MAYKSPPIGNEISCVMRGVSNAIINDCRFLENALLEALKRDEFGILKKISHEFNPKGITILILLSESHAAIHTYPEYNSLTFHLYSCRSPEDGRKTLEFLKEKIKPSSSDINERPVIVKTI